MECCQNTSSAFLWCTHTRTHVDILTITTTNHTNTSTVDVHGEVQWSMIFGSTSKSSVPKYVQLLPCWAHNLYNLQIHIRPEPHSHTAGVSFIPMLLIGRQMAQCLASFHKFTQKLIQSVNTELVHITVVLFPAVVNGLSCLWNFFEQSKGAVQFNIPLAKATAQNGYTTSIFEYLLLWLFNIRHNCLYNLTHWSLTGTANFIAKNCLSSK